METHHRYEEREAEEERREELAEQKRQYLPPPRATLRTTDEILDGVREMCESLTDPSDRTSCMLGALAKQIQILEREKESLVLDQLDRLE